MGKKQFTDIMDDSDSEDTFVIGEKTHKKLSEARYKDGYRDGVTDGQNLSLQDGFNEGYSLGYNSVYNVARLRGILWSLVTANENAVLSEEVMQIFKDSEDQMKVVAASLSPTTASNVDKIDQMEKQILAKLKNCFLEECKRLNLTDDDTALQLYLSVTL